MLLNPFQRLDGRLVSAFLRTDRRWLVTQTFSRCRAPGDKVPLLCTDYDDAGLALIHKKALRGDRFGALLDLAKAAHEEKLLAMLRPESQYLMYAAIVKSRDGLARQFNRLISENIRRYIAANTRWNISAGKTVSSSFETTFGELFVNLKFGTELLRVRLEDVEKS